MLPVTDAVLLLVLTAVAAAGCGSEIDGATDFSTYENGVVLFSCSAHVAVSGYTVV